MLLRLVFNQYRTSLIQTIIRFEQAGTGAIQSYWAGTGARDDSAGGLTLLGVTVYSIEGDLVVAVNIEFWVVDLPVCGVVGVLDQMQFGQLVIGAAVGAIVGTGDDDPSIADGAGAGNVYV